MSGATPLFLSPSPPGAHSEEQWLDWTVRRTPEEFSTRLKGHMDNLRQFAIGSLKCPDCGASIDRATGEATRSSKRGRPAADRVIDLDGSTPAAAAAEDRVFDLDDDDDSDGGGAPSSQPRAVRGGTVCVDGDDDDSNDDDNLVALDDSDDDDETTTPARRARPAKAPATRNCGRAVAPARLPVPSADGDDDAMVVADDDEGTGGVDLSTAADDDDDDDGKAPVAACVAPQLVLESSRTAPVVSCSVCSCRVLATSGTVARGTAAGRFVVPARQAVASLLDHATARVAATPAVKAPTAASRRRPTKPASGTAAATAKAPSSSTAYSGQADDAQQSAAAVAAAHKRQATADTALGEAFKRLRRALPNVTATEAGGSIAAASASALIELAAGRGYLRLPVAAALAADTPLLLALLEAPAVDVGPPANILPGIGSGPVEGSAWVASSCVGSASAAAPAGPSKALRRPKRGRPSAAAKAAEAKAAAEAEGAAARLRARLPDVLCPLLRTSMQDMASRTELYFPLLSACEAIAGCPATAPLLVWVPPDDEQAADGAAPVVLPVVGRAMVHFARLVAKRVAARPTSQVDVSSMAPAGSIAALLQTLSDAASLYCQTADAALGAAADDVSAFTADEAAQYTRVRVLAGRAQSSVATVKSGLLVAAARLVLAAYSPGASSEWADARAGPSPATAAAAPAVAAAAASAAAGGSTTALAAAGKAGADSSPWIARVAFVPSDEAVAEYKRRMRPLAFSMVPGLAAAHAFRKLAAPSASRKQLKRLMRVATELSALPTTALEWASSVLARSDEARMDLVRVAVLGPADTPYMNGVAMVDLMLPASYPDAPPLASFVSTAGGAVRFNPNLYSNGKVCLSLLGTWAGPSWSPGQSTLAQVLLAIQGQIMNSNPWLNEPGFRPVAQHCSQYNCVLRLATLQHLILAPLRSPPPLFRQAVITHFTLKREELREQCTSWTAEAARLAVQQRGPCACQQYHVFSSGSPLNSSLKSVSDATRAACSEIRTLLDALPPLSEEPC